MKKFFFSLFVLTSFSLYAQTTLPTSWDSQGTPPSGWTLSGTTFYTGSGNPLPAIRFDNTADYVEIFFSDEPGLLTYDLAGNSFSGGTFTIKESPDGISYSTLRTITAPSAGTYDPFSDTPLSTTRYIRFEYTNKVSGNIGVDNINIALPVAGPSQEIDVLQGTDRIPTGGMAIIASPVSNMIPLNLTIENEGTVNTLNITSTVVTGTNASEFVVTTTPSSIAALSSSTLTIEFTPTASGTRTAVLTIVNDDANENPYIINLYGVGGTLATEPATQPTNISFTNVKTYRYRVTYSGAGADGYIVLRRKGAAVTDVPVDGTVYSKGDGIGNSKVAYIGSASTFVPRDVRADMDYHYAVFSYNGPSVYVNYNTTSPLTGNVITPSTMQNASEYSGIDRNSATFISDLTTLINPHSQIFYSDYQRTIVENFYERDTSNGERVTTCVYTSYDHIYTPPMDWSILSREHTIADSWMTTTGDNSTKQYSDLHNLFPVQFANSNQVRSNYPLGEVVNVTSSFMDGTFGTNGSGQIVYEPRDEHKGDAARAMFYMMTCYNGTNGTWGFDNGLLAQAPNQDQDVLKTWHWNDPVDGFEMSRNDYIDSLQGNRNPFIDSMSYACAIDFNNMAKINNSAPCLSTVLGVDEQIISVISSIYPNPTSNKITIETTIEENDVNTLQITDLAGRVVFNMNISFATGRSQFTIDVAQLPDGIYLIDLLNKNGNSITTSKFIKE